MRAKTKSASLLRRTEAGVSIRQAGPAPALPPAFLAWFERRGWSPRPHQIALLEKAAARRSTLLIAPTGSGKTLAGFLPSLVALAAMGRARGERSIHTLYISPLKALAADVERNLLAPLAEMDLPIRVRDPHRRHLRFSQGASKGPPAGYSAHHTRAGGTAAVAS